MQEPAFVIQADPMQSDTVVLIALAIGDFLANSPVI